jgi:hypothetical protein
MSNAVRTGLNGVASNAVYRQKAIINKCLNNITKAVAQKAHLTEKCV